MPQLKIYLDKELTQEIHGDTVDAGEWDLERGTEIKLYLKNASIFLTASFIEKSSSDPRVILSMPDQILPEQTVEAILRIPPTTLGDNEDEQTYFADLFNQISASVKWTR